MRFRVFSPAAVLLLSTTLFVSTTFGQSLSIRKTDTNYWVKASPPQSTGFSIQETENFKLWVDSDEEVQPNAEFQFYNTGVPGHYFRLVPTPPRPYIRVLMIGDSLTSDDAGWGQGMYRYFHLTDASETTGAFVYNYAEAFASTSVFVGQEDGTGESAQWDKMLLTTPDYVLIQFGFLDSDPGIRGTTPTQFASNLRKIVQAVRGFNGTPILVTIHAARLWDDQGNLVPAWEDRNEIIRQIAAEEKVYLIDLRKSSSKLIQQLGKEGSAFMQYVEGDPIHLSPLGARYIARLVVNALPDKLGPYLQGIFDPPPKP